jgi:hypothetical protein
LLLKHRPQAGVLPVTRSDDACLDAATVSDRQVLPLGPLLAQVTAGGRHTGMAEELSAGAAWRRRVHPDLARGVVGHGAPPAGGAAGVGSKVLGAGLSTLS